MTFSMKIITNNILLLVFVSICNISYSQSNTEKIYDHKTDTLIVLGEKIVDTYTILINREALLNIDLLSVNQNDLKVVSFSMNALALGQNITLNSKSNVLTTEMKNEILNKYINYKFIYLKNILLESKDGQEFLPSTKNIKIVFKN